MLTISLSLNFHENPSYLKASRTLLKNEDTLLEFRRTWRFQTGARVLDHVFLCVSLMTISLCFNFHENPSYLKASRTLLKNDDTLLEFRRTWRFLIGAGVLDHVLDVFL